ncbi:MULTISPECIES: glycosyltransferase [Bacillus]|uniref:Spore coat protein CotS n=1 Tax=Bacillus pseudomycoides TaxID=64104 RepID=A0A1Y3MM51_9BACI|nr:glycosyltransferase [Bacillus pseudomycoides]OUM49951.1 spore coat protein CotS [Bacillus pseudomycoides]PEK72200.1 spore coat protein CotS [Bacillus pseudomycoides]PGE85922.1 spore coat protein CotS [Bacillus pseudomycoides]
MKNRINFLSGPLKKYSNDQGFKRTVRYTDFYVKLDLDEKVILYESFHGKGMTDSPYAIFKKIIDNPEYKDYTHVWALNDGNNFYAKRYENKKNVKFVKVHSEEYLKYLTTAKYLINNTTFPPYFQKKEGQIYVNTWHGTPIKTLGKDMKGEIGQHKNIQRNFMHCDYILNPNKFTADTIVNSHDLEGLYSGYVVDEGYPRIDLTLQVSPEEVKGYLKEFVEIDETKKIVLYAPTWRGGVNQVNNIKDEINNIVKKMYSQIPSDYQLLLKVHTLTYKFIKDDESLREICIPDWVDPNELMSIVDVLVTDYSSIFFDYMVTEKPIIFLAYDKKEYEEQRGLYVQLEDMPGPICHTVDEVIHSIENIDSVKNDYSVKYQETLKKYCYHDDGNATERAIDIIFRGKHTANVYKVTNENKKNILMYCGGFLNNGITTSVINLLNNIDYSRYNVAVIDKGKHDSISRDNFLQINPNVKKFYRVGSLNTTLKESYQNNYVMKMGLKNEKAQKALPKQLYKREVSRLFGNAEFDIVIDFSGYVPFWTLLFAFGDFKKRSIYQHNDMWAEYSKKINGKFKHKANLNIIFPLYKEFDKIVAVAEHTRNLNRKNLKDYITLKQGVYVHNAIDPNKVLKQIEEGDIYKFEGKEYLLKENIHENGRLEIKGIEMPNKEDINFVNMGRLSPEKDQKKLIHAFSKVAELYDNVKLYIIGDGVLKEELGNLVRAKNLEGKVFFTGQMSNPFLLINQCDCFVLSSNHEGQPMVLLEALILGKPIVATDIAGSRSILEDGYGELVENNIAGLVIGLQKFILNQTSFKEFDFQKYNEHAFEMFYDEVCALEEK